MANDKDFWVEIDDEAEFHAEQPIEFTPARAITEEKKFLLLVEFERGVKKIGITGNPAVRPAQYGDELRDVIVRLTVWDYGSEALAEAIEQQLLTAFQHRRILKPSTGRPTEYLRGIEFHTVLSVAEDLAIHHRARKLDTTELENGA